MAKQKKYIDDSEMFRAAEQTKELVKEVASDCKLTLSELASKLRGNGLQISDGLMRQYSSGQKPMGDQRRHDFVSIAVRKLGCRSRTAINLMTFENLNHIKRMRALFTDVEQGKRFAEELFDRAVHELVDWGVDGKQIRLMLSTALTKYEPIEGAF